MSVPDHQIDPPESYVTAQEVDGYSYVTAQEVDGYFEVEGHLNAYFDDPEADALRYIVRFFNPCAEALLPRYESYCKERYSTLTEQILDIFKTPFPQEENALRWWTTESRWDGFHIPTTHQKRTRYYLEKYPWWKLWKINKKLEEEKLSPTIDHPRSDIVIGKSKAAGAYYQHNDNFKKFIEGLLPL